MSLFSDLLALPSLFPGGVTALLLAASAFLYRRFRKAQQSEQDVVSYLDFAPEADQLQIVDFRAAGPRKELARSFAEALRVIDESLPQPEPRYQIPWFVMLGESGGGKTTALNGVDLRLRRGVPVEQPGQHSMLNWWHFDRAIVLDLRGDLVMRSDGETSDQTAFSAFLEALVEHRGQRPLDGAVVVVPADRLIGRVGLSGDWKKEARQRGELLFRRLVQTQQELGMTLPVTVLVSRCDRLEGFSSFLQSVGQEQSTQILGGGVQAGQETASPLALTGDILSGIEEGLDRIQLVELGSGELPASELPEFFVFPAELQALEPSLKIYLSQIFSASEQVEPMPLRTVAFSGASVSAEEEAGLWEESSESLGEIAGSGQEETAGALKVSFLTELFDFKVFSEWRLAQPTNRALAAARQRRRRGRLLTVGMICFGFAALALGQRQVSKRGADLAAYFERCRLCLTAPEAAVSRPGFECSDPDPDVRREAQARVIVAGANEVGDYRLRSIFLPASWWGGARSSVDAVVGLQQGAVLRSMGDLLTSRLENPPQMLAPSPRPQGPYLAVDETEPFRRLSSLLVELEMLEQYNLVAQGASRNAGELLASYGALTSHLYGIEVELPTRRARDFYGTVLRRVRAAPLTTDELGSAIAVHEKRVLQVAGEMYSEFFNDHLLEWDLDQVHWQLERLQGWSWESCRSEAGFRDLQQAIDETRADLDRPDLTWVSAPGFDLGPAHEALLTKIAASPYLGKTMAETIRWQGSTAMETFRKRILGFEAPLVGTVLAQQQSSEPIALAADVENLSAGLGDLLGQSYLQTVETGSLSLAAISRQAGSQQQISWIPLQLAAALALSDDYQNLLPGVLESLPAGMREVSRRAALEGLECNSLERLDRALLLEFVPDQRTPPQRKTNLQALVTNLTTAAEGLHQQLGVFDDLGLGRGARELRQVLADQRFQLLSSLTQLLRDLELYRPREGSFDWWDGQPVLAFDAFDVADTEALETYLGQQLDLVSELQQTYGTPILAAIDPSTVPSFDSTPLVRLWLDLGTDLLAFEQEQAGDAISQLHDFIASDLTLLATANCSSSLAAVRKPPRASGYFLAQRQCLVDGLRPQCETVAHREAYEGYRAIQHEFETHLAGAFPFTRRSEGFQTPAATSERQVTPEELRIFFRVFDRHQAVIQSLPKGEVGEVFGTQGRAVAAFMERMSAVRALFAGFLEDPASLGPSYKLAVEFRADRQRESLIEGRRSGSNILDWSLDVTGPTREQDKVLQLGDGDLTAEWAYQREPVAPVDVRFDWATDGELIPFSWSPRDDFFTRREDCSLIVHHSGPWSLFSLLSHHGQPSPSSAQPGDPIPITLKFDVATAPMPDPFIAQQRCQPAPETKAGAVATVFLRVTLLDDGEDPQPLPFPAPFPYQAPRLASATFGSEVAGNGPWCPRATRGLIRQSKEAERERVPRPKEIQEDPRIATAAINHW